ncbi:MAG: hypothetical protein FWC75_09215 [Oscillospiraceae bacterium]|nr:hypothetical protein [Oscillospiraceae bacterium]
MSKPNDHEAENENKKWDFEDYAFTIATVLFLAPVIIGILIAIFLDNDGQWAVHRWWPFSWMSFMFAWSACEIKDVVDIKLKRGIARADNNLEEAAEHALYIVITTGLLLAGLIIGQMQSSWLAGPIVFVLLTVIWPLLRNQEDKEKTSFPTIPVIILIAGIVAEVIIGGWIAFPVSWILISIIKLYKTIRKCKFTEDFIVDIAYYAFTIILLTTSLIWGSWVISWLAYPISVIIGKVMCKIKRKSA